MMATDRDFDVIVIGGAAGLSAALFTTRRS